MRNICSAVTEKAKPEPYGAKAPQPCYMSPEALTHLFSILASTWKPDTLSVSWFVIEYYALFRNLVTTGFDAFSFSSVASIQKMVLH